MAHPIVQTSRPDDRLLLSAQGVAALPSPVALQLLEIPIVLPLQKHPPRAAGAAPSDRLPDALWRLEFELTGADRTRYRVRVTGDPVLGLPYGRDADVLLALFRILDEERGVHDMASGTFRQPSFQMICRALGMGATGPLVQRIRDALRRLSHVRVESRVLVDRSVEAAGLLGGEGGSGAAPAAPTAGTIRRHEVEESRWLLEYRTEERTEEEVGGADETPGRRARVERTLWIHELRLNPFWVNQAISGWAGWIDVERHADLQSITARRLYQLCAAQAARHVRLPWVFGEEELRTACLLTTEGKKPTRVRQMLSEAAAELAEAGVLSSHAWHGAPRRGPMELVLEPGPLLQLSGLLRGIGLTDPPDVRVQYALLRAFGVTAPKARALIAEKPGQVAEVLLRACHLRATDPTAVTKSWAGWIIHHVEHETSFAGEVAFQQWRRTALARLDEGAASSPAREGAGVVGAGGVPSPAEEPPPRALPAPPRPAPEPAAATRWSAALAVVRPTLSVLDYYGVEDGVPIGGDAESITVAATNDIAARALQRLAPRLEAALAEEEGRAVAVRVVPVSRANG